MSNQVVTDEQMREAVLFDIRAGLRLMLHQADREQRAADNAKLPAFERRECEACASYSRRQAAHYQQAIDLLTKAPMPTKDRS